MSGAEAASETHASVGRWMVFTAATLWGTSATLARFVFRDHQVPPLTVVELRLWVACLILGPWLALKKPAALRIRKKDWLYLLALGLFGVAAVQGTYYYSIAHLGVGLSILLQYLAPALIVLYEWARGRRPSRFTSTAVVAAALGTALLVGDLDPASLEASPLDWVVGFGSAIAFAFYVAFSKRGLTLYAPETVLFYTFAIAAVFWSVVTPPWQILSRHYEPRLWTLFVVIGLASTLIPFAFFYCGLRRLSPDQAAIFATLEPPIAVVSAAIFLHEGLEPLQWLGALCVLSASVLASLQRPVQGAITAERV